MICRRYFVSGRVQGVFYRETTRRMANQLGLHGWVRNLRDGRVEVLAGGDEESLQQLQNWLQIGPDAAKVTNIECIDAPCPEIDGHGGFRVEPTV